MATKRQLSDGGADPPRTPPTADPPHTDDAGGPMVSIWSCDNPSIEVEFPVQHAWLLLRNYSAFMDFSKGEILRRLQEVGGDAFTQVEKTMPPVSFCTEEVLKCIRGYVRDYVHPDGSYEEVAEWNFRGDAQLAIGERRAIGVTLELGPLCWKLLQAANFLDIEIWPAQAVMIRNRAVGIGVEGPRSDGVTYVHAHAQLFASKHAVCIQTFARTHTGAQNDIQNQFLFVSCHQIARFTTKFARSWPALFKTQQASKRSEISVE